MCYIQDSFFGRMFSGSRLPCVPVPCSSKHVSDDLAKEISTWKAYPVLINAPTGSGKSTFVFEYLASYAKQRGQTILVLSNRISLLMQQKQDLWKKMNVTAIGTNVLDDYYYYDNIILSSYQSVMSLAKNPSQFQVPPINPSYVVFDEAHFFCSDATFNPWTEVILYYLIQTFYSAVRIYMTATPNHIKAAIETIENECFETLSVGENIPNNDIHYAIKRYSTPKEDKIIKEYVFDQNYDHINLRFFSNWATITDAINSDGSNDKWIIFVSNKELGKECKSEIDKNLATYIDADYSGEAISVLARRQRFSSKVLISTSVIDNGISITDSSLKNIVVDFTDYVQFIQMIGRKRITDSNEVVNLFVRIPDEKEIENRYKKLERLYETLNSFEKNPISFMYMRWGTLSESEQKIFLPFPLRYAQYNDYTNCFQIRTNTFTRYQLAVLCGEYQQLLDDVAEDIHAYEKVVCKWLKKSFQPESIIDFNQFEEFKDKVYKLIVPFVDKEVKRDDLADIVEEIVKIIPKSHKIAIHFKELTPKRGAENFKKVVKFYGLPFELPHQNGKKYTYIITMQQDLENADFSKPSSEFSKNPEKNDLDEPKEDDAD